MVFQVAFGRNVYAGMSLCVLQCIPLFVVFVFIGRTREEAINEACSWLKSIVSKWVVVIFEGLSHEKQRGKGIC